MALPDAAAREALLCTSRMRLSTVFEVPSIDFFALWAITSTSMFSLNSFIAEPVRLADSLESVLIVEGKSSVTIFFDSLAMFCVVPSKFSRRCKSEIFFATDFCTVSMLPLTSSTLVVAVSTKSDATDFERSKIFVGVVGVSLVVVFFLFLFSLSLLLLLLVLVLFFCFFSCFVFLFFPRSRTTSFFTVIDITRSFAIANAASASFLLASIAEFNLFAFSFNSKRNSFVIFSAFFFKLLSSLLVFSSDVFFFFFLCSSSRFCCCLRASVVAPEDEEEDVVVVIFVPSFTFSTTSFHFSSIFFLSRSRRRTRLPSLFSSENVSFFFFDRASSSSAANDDGDSFLRRFFFAVVVVSRFKFALSFLAFSFASSESLFADRFIGSTVFSPTAALIVENHRRVPDDEE